MRSLRAALVAALAVIGLTLAGCGSESTTHREPLDLSHTVTYIITGPDAQSLLGQGRSTAATVVAKSRADTKSLLGSAQSSQRTPTPASPTQTAP